MDSGEIFLMGFGSGYATTAHVSSGALSALARLYRRLPECGIPRR